MTTIAVIMDPMEGLNTPVDTSFAFMLAAQARGHRVMHVLTKNVFAVHDRTMLRGHIVEVRDKPGDHFTRKEALTMAAVDCQAVFVRSDPPFDEAYLTLSWLLQYAENAGARIINSPRGLRAASEHLYALEFPELCPRTLVSNHRGDIRDFVLELGGTAIAKPIDGHGGFGVVRLVEGDSNLNALIDLLSLEGKQPIIVQAYVPEAAQGDKRLILVDGELRGAVMRVPTGGDHRGNVHVGGQVKACAPDDADRAICDAMRSRLKSDGLFFVGLDVIGGKLIEVNVTSPTLVREIKDLGGPDIAAEVIDAVS